MARLKLESEAPSVLTLIRTLTLTLTLTEALLLEYETLRELFQGGLGEEVSRNQMEHDPKHETKTKPNGR